MHFSSFLAWKWDLDVTWDQYVCIVWHTTLESNDIFCVMHWHTMKLTLYITNWKPETKNPQLQTRTISFRSLISDSSSTGSRCARDWKIE